MKTRKISLVMLVVFLSFILFVPSVFATGWTKVLETGTWTSDNDDYWITPDLAGDASLQFNQTITNLNQAIFNVTFDGDSWYWAWSHLCFNDIKFWVTDNISFYGFYVRLNYYKDFVGETYADIYFHLLLNGTIIYVGYRNIPITWYGERLACLNKFVFCFWKNSTTVLGLKMFFAEVDIEYGWETAWGNFVQYINVDSDFWNSTISQYIWKGGDGWIEGEKIESITSGSSVTPPTEPPPIIVPTGWIGELVNTITTVFGLFWGMANVMLPFLGIIVVVWFVSGIPECGEQMSFSPMLEKRLLPMYNFFTGAIQIFVTVAEALYNGILKVLTWLGLIGVGA